MKPVKCAAAAFLHAYPCELFLVHLCVTGSGVFRLLLCKNRLRLLVLRLTFRRRFVDPGVQVQALQTYNDFHTSVVKIIMNALKF